MKYRVEQLIHYTYDGSVNQSINQCRMKPLSDGPQHCLMYELSVNPEAKCYHHIDYWGNHVDTVYVWEGHQTLTIHSKAIVQIQYMPFPTPTFHDRVWETLQLPAFQSRYSEYLSHSSYTQLSQETMENMTKPLWEASFDPFDYVNRVNQFIYHNFKYQRSTDVNSTAADLIRLQEGVCQDFTHLMLALCRYRSIPARYVSGYIYCGEDSAMRGNSATHAWVEVLMPESGWIGFDPTNNMLAHDQHIRVAVGRDYKDIVPMKGVYRGGAQQMEVKVSVSLLDSNGNGNSFSIAK